MTKKSNVLDKGKPNILNSAAKKLQNNDSSNNNNNNNNSNAGADINDSGMTKNSRHYEREVTPPPQPAPVVPEVTVSY